MPEKIFNLTTNEEIGPITHVKLAAFKDERPRPYRKDQYTGEDDPVEGVLHFWLSKTWQDGENKYEPPIVGLQGTISGENYTAIKPVLDAAEQAIYAKLEELGYIPSGVVEDA